MKNRTPTVTMPPTAGVTNARASTQGFSTSGQLKTSRPSVISRHPFALARYLAGSVAGFRWGAVTIGAVRCESRVNRVAADRILEIIIW